jgi:hypothetical protein
MPVQGSMQSLTAVVASNSPAGSDSISNTLDDYLRSIQGILRYTEAQGATLTSTASMSLGAATGGYVHITGTDSIAHLGTLDAGILRTTVFDSAAKLVPSASLIMPASATIETAVGDIATWRSEGSGAWRCLTYQRAAGHVFDIVFGLDTGADGAYIIVQKASFPFLITNAVTKCASGTITANIKIESTSVTSLDAIAMDSSEADTAATGANAVATGNTVSVTFSSNSTALGVIVQLRCVRV